VLAFLKKESQEGACGRSLLKGVTAHRLGKGKEPGHRGGNSEISKRLARKPSGPGAWYLFNVCQGDIQGASGGGTPRDLKKIIKVNCRGQGHRKERKRDTTR